MIADLAARVDDSLRYSGILSRLSQSIGIRFGVNKSQRIDRDHFGVELFKLAVVVEHRKPLPGANAEVITALRAYLTRLFQITLVKMGVTRVAFDEHVLRFYHPLLGWHGLYLFVLFTEPGHRKLKFELPGYVDWLIWYGQSLTQNQITLKIR